MNGAIVFLEKCLFNESKFKTKEVRYNVYLILNPNDSEILQTTSYRTNLQ